MKKLFLICLYLIPALLFGVESQRVVIQNFEREGLHKLSISNAYGNITLRKDTASEITVEAIVKADVIEEIDTIKIFPYIQHEMYIADDQLKIKTDISEDLDDTNPVHIQYLISIPDTMDLEITNRYGDIILFDVYGTKDFKIEYGNIIASNLAGPDFPRSSYSVLFGSLKADSSCDAHITLNSSELQINDISEVEIQSLFSLVSIGNCDELHATSSSDKYALNQVNLFNYKGNNSACHIQHLNDFMEMELDTGEVSLEHISAKFTDVNLFLQDVNASLQIMKGASFYLNATLEYGDLVYPENMVVDKVTDLNTQSYNGQLGEADSSGSQIGIIGTRSQVTIKTAQ